MPTGTSAYRQVLRAINIAFREDYKVLTAARDTARQKFSAFQSSTATVESIEQAIAQAVAVSRILRENVVQGENTTGDTYRLRIHDLTERGDNMTVKKLDKRVKSFKDMKS